MNKDKKIFIAGSSGMVGSSIVRNLQRSGFENLLTPPRKELNLLDYNLVNDFLKINKPDYIIMAAAKVGGIYANNNFGADFIFDNTQIQNNVIHAAHTADINNLLFLGSSCVYPKHAKQPIKEEYLLTGPLEPTNEAYAIAKISGIKLCENYKKQYKRNYFSVMPTNLYGPNDNYDLANSHVLPALLYKAHQAKLNNASEMTVWGSGKVKREFLYVDDLAEACIHLINIDYSGSMLNIGTGIDITIDELAKKIMSTVGIDVRLVYDKNFPDGTPRKVLDVSKINKLGWSSSTSLQEGLSKVYNNKFLDK